MAARGASQRNQNVQQSWEVFAVSVPEDRSGSIGFTLLFGNRDSSKGGKAFSVMIL